jgi:hypothetical protein
MQLEAIRLRRLQRLERVRAIASKTLATEAAQAEGTFAQLDALAERTRAMTSDYRGRSRAESGFELRQLGQFLAGLQGISVTTSGDADRARDLADRKQQEFALAERRRAAVEDRVIRAQRDLAEGRVLPVLGARRAVGTGLE